MHAPPHSLNALPADGVAVRVTLLPAPKDATHVAPQLIPDGLDVTEPDPVLVTVKVTGSANVAVTVFGPVTANAASSVTVQVDEVPQLGIDQPVNTLPGTVVAVRVTLDAEGKS